jgi:hypothetical protein
MGGRLHHGPLPNMKKETMNIKALLRLTTAMALAALLGACSSVTPSYQPSVTSVDVTANLGAPLAVGKFEYAPGREAELNNVGARIVSFVSPVNGSYADYFADAAAKDLKAAGKLDPASPKVLTGMLLKNYLSAAGASVSQCELQVRFRLSSGGQITYEKVIEARREDESSFIGALAYPRAVASYSATLQLLLRNLFSDPEFISATKAR